MGYIVVFCIGILAGILIAANIMMDSDIAKREEAYYKGIEDGKRIALEKKKEE